MGIVPTIIIFYFALSALAYLLSGIFDLPSLWSMDGAVIPPNAGVVLAAAVGLLVHAVSTFVRRRLGWTEGFYKTVAKVMGKPGTPEVALVAGASAIGEELLFRGALLPLIGLWPQAIVFGILHFGPGKELRFWPFYAAAMGLVLGLFYQISGSLLAPIVAHFTVNFFGLMSLPREETPEPGQ